jgi:hypothetical protein
MLLTPAEVRSIQDEVNIFMARRHFVKHEVLRAVLIYSITAVKLFNGESALPNEAYLRKTLETFKAEKIRNAASALVYMRKQAEARDKLKKLKIIKNPKPQNPKFVDEFLRELEEWGESTLDNKTLDEIKKTLDESNMN